MITIQYLEPGPQIATITPFDARQKLQVALDYLPIDCLLLGWDIPSAIEDICRNTAASAGVKLYRWHPLLTGDGTIYPHTEWRLRNSLGEPLPGFRGLPEFTFVCANNLAARTTILEHIKNLAQSGRYDGIFLDRMRYLSPAADPLKLMSCFCKHCSQAAMEVGLDLMKIQQSLLDVEASNLIRIFFGEIIPPLSDFLEFRCHTITQFIAEIVEIIRSVGLGIGFDCFPTSLTHMVGQDLSELAPLADWTKIMIYGHANGPATLPFEFTDLTNWLVEQKNIDVPEALSILTAISNFKLPNSVSSLQDKGFSPKALAFEYACGQEQTHNSQLFAGIELVEIPGVSELNNAQIEADLRAIKAIGAGGLSLSWDLWHIPLERLKLVRTVWSS